MWKTVIFCIAAAHCSLGQTLDEGWNLFKNEYRKVYKNTREEIFRKNVWMQRTKNIQLHNEAADMGIYSFWMGMNLFGDMTNSEIMNYTGGVKIYSDKKFQGPKGESFVSNKRLHDLPPEVDWRKKGAVTRVVSQGQCGSSPYFAAAGSLEGQFAIRTGTLTVLSVQNLLDCSYKQGNYGCNGGLMDSCFQYVADNQGIDSNVSYPYEAKTMLNNCRFVRSGVVGTDVGFTDIEKGNEASLQRAVADVGPIACAIDASRSSFQFYKSGVYDDPACSSTQIDHGILVIGYGTEKSSGKEYWLLKNTFGVTWGMKGYVKIARNHDNRCGVATMASFPLV